MPIALVVEYEPILMIQADEAIAVLEGRDDIRVVVTDVQMPGSMDGMKLARAVRDRWPPILIIVVSGHIKPKMGDLPENVTFLSKPYSDNQMHQALSLLSR
jgi:CheY-like chemotaxis protein